MLLKHFQQQRLYRLKFFSDIALKFLSDIASVAKKFESYKGYKAAWAYNYAALFLETEAILL